MNEGSSSISKAKDHAEQAIDKAVASPWTERLARFGFAAKGAVYIVIGALATLAAFGSGGGETTNKQGALQTIAAQSYGTLLLGALALGLVGFVLWRFVQALKDPEHPEGGAKRIPVRGAYVVSALVYASLAVAAVQLIMKSGSGGNSNATQDWTARLLQQPFGQWLVAGVGAIIVGVGLYQFYKAFVAKFRKRWNLGQMSEATQTWATRAGRFGLAARGVVFTLVGVFLIQAALRFDPRRAEGIDGALQALAEQTYGQLLLGAVAIGLIAYGIYMFIEARYRQIRMN